MSGKGVPLIEGSLRRQLLEVTLSEAPREAVGIIWQDQVHTLPNTSQYPENQFAVNLGDLRNLIDELKVPWEQLHGEVYFWHSHPSGGVGPSRFDATHKTPMRNHLVVSLVEGDIVPTWY